MIHGLKYLLSAITFFLSSLLSYADNMHDIDVSSGMKTGQMTQRNELPADININNSLGTLRINDGTKLDTGNVNIKSIQADSITIKTKNVVRGDIQATDGSSVSIGSTAIGSAINENTSQGGNQSGTNPDTSQRVIPPSDTALFLPPGGVSAIPGLTPGVQKTVDDCLDMIDKKSEKCSIKCAQTTGCNIVDGCSIPFPDSDWVGSLLGKGLFGSEESCCSNLIGPSSLDLPCNNHDRCYQTWGSNKILCDLTLADEIFTKCMKTYINILMCDDLASTYFWGVFFWGHNSYNERQHEYMTGNAKDEYDKCIKETVPNSSDMKRCEDDKNGTLKDWQKELGWDCKKFVNDEICFAKVR